MGKSNHKTRKGSVSKMSVVAVTLKDITILHTEERHVAGPGSIIWDGWYIKLPTRAEWYRLNTKGANMTSVPRRAIARQLDEMAEEAEEVAETETLKNIANLRNEYDAIIEELKKEIKNLKISNTKLKKAKEDEEE